MFRSWYIILAFLFCGCAATNPPAPYPFKTHPKYEISPKPERILLLNRYDVARHKFRDNKEELFLRLIDSVLATSASEIKERTGAATEIIPGLTNFSTGRDSSIYSLLKNHNASHAIVVDSFTVYFEQTNVQVTKTSSGKDREAFYDIVSEIDFSFYNTNELFKQLHMRERRRHSSRNVVSGLLAAGPNIVSQRKDAWRITHDNLVNYLNLFFEGK